MYSLLAQIARLIAGSPSRPETVAQRLMEGAEARSGLDPQQAQELRGAACAYLRVVR